MYVSVCGCAHLSVRACGDHMYQIPLELELQAALGALSQTWVLCKSSICSKLQRCLSSPPLYIVFCLERSHGPRLASN